jgi:hypothetical protein
MDDGRRVETVEWALRYTAETRRLPHGHRKGLIEPFASEDAARRELAARQDRVANHGAAWTLGAWEVVSRTVVTCTWTS